MNNKNKHIDNELLTRFLSGETSAEEQEIVRQWKNASSENLAMFDELQKTWLLLDKTTLHQHIDMDAEWNLHRKKYISQINKPSRTISFQTYFRVAASVLIILGLSWLGWATFSKTSIQAGIAETCEIILPDGSKVTINAGSKLYYPRSFAKAERVVSLTGEAFFEVTKNPKSPFIINVDGARIKVLGTSFNVKAYKNQSNIEVTVVEGKVSLYEQGSEQKKIIIVKGEKAVFSKDTKTILKQENDNRNFIAWKTLSINFENDSLPEIANILSNVYHKEFIIQDPNIRHCTVTTSFINKKLPDVLKILKETLDIVIEEKEGKIYIRGKGC